MVLVVVSLKGTCRGPMSSALPSHSPGARSTRPAGRAPEPPRGRAGSSPRAPVISTSPESICSNRPHPGPGLAQPPSHIAPVDGLVPLLSRSHRRQSFHQGLHRPLNTPADRVPRDPPRGRRGAGSTAPRRRRPRPGRPWPAPRSAGLDADPALRERVVDPPGGSGPVPGRIAARLRFENPDDGGMRICHEQIYQARVRPGRRQPARPVAGGGGPAHRTHPPHPPLPTGRRSPNPGARAGSGAPPSVCARPRGDDRAVPGHWEADPIIGGDPRQRPDHPGGGVAAGSC